MGRRQAKATREPESVRSGQLGQTPLRGNADLTSAFPPWSSQHNPVSEHLHYLNFILCWGLLIGQTWLTASEVRSDRHGACRTTAQNSSQEGDGTSCWIYEAQAHRCLLQGLGLAQGWEGLGCAWEEGMEKGRWNKHSHPNDQALGFLVSPHTTPSSSYLLRPEKAPPIHAFIPEQK